MPPPSRVILIADVSQESSSARKKTFLRREAGKSVPAGAHNSARIVCLRDARLESPGGDDRGKKKLANPFHEGKSLPGPRAAWSAFPRRCGRG